MKKFEQPTVEQNPSRHTDSVERHPAYAQIGASRVSGSACLYGSDFRHQHYVTISIHASELNRSLSRDWPFAREEYIEVALSEAQWATFVSAMNVGQGVQCTLNHLQGRSIPQIPEPPNRRDKFTREAADDMRQAVASLTELRQQIDALGVSKKAKDALLSTLHITERAMTDSLPFVAKSFTEHVESVTEHAKVEVNAYMQHQLRSLRLVARQKIAMTSEATTMSKPSCRG